MSEKFTKGQWDVEVGCTQAFVIGGNKFLHEGSIDFNTCERGERVANAHLIAAAPEMYEMLKECQREIKFLINEVNQHRTTNHSRYEDTPPDLYDQESLYLISKLLSKARGEL